MNMLRRLLLCLWSLAMIATAALAGLSAFRPAVAGYTLRRLETALASGLFFWWLLLAGVVLLLLGMLGVFVALARKPAPTQVVVGSSAGGQVNISLAAVDTVVRKAALSVEGVKEVKSRLKPTSGGVGIGLEIAIPPDLNVPEIASTVQQAVKTQLQTVTGLAVAEVTVLVSTVEDNKTAKTL